MDAFAIDHPVTCRRIVAESLTHLVRLVGPKGRFVYAHPMGRPDQPLDGYNMLRHCGTLWFMLRALNDQDKVPDAATAGALARAVGYAGARLKPPAWTAVPSLALETKGALKTGGAGLALCMLHEWRRLAGRIAVSGAWLPVSLDGTIAAVRAYGLAQIDGDDFLHKRDLATGAVLPFRSDYYTGEVILGLLLTGPAEPDLARVTRALMARRYGWAEQSHWMAYAACEAVERGTVPEAEGAAYLAGLVAEITGNPAYRLRRASTPIACRTEALTRILTLAARRPGLLAADLLATARQAAVENLTLQAGWYARGQFAKGDEADTVQIDYIQHNATSWLNLLVRP